MSDNVIYMSDTVKVTTSFVCLKGKTYFLENINSIWVQKRDDSKCVKNVIACAVILLGAIWFLNHTALPKISLGVVILGIIGLSFRSIRRLLSPMYFLVFSTSDGTKQALADCKKDYLFMIKKAIEQACASYTKQNDNAKPLP